MHRDMERELVSTGLHTQADFDLWKNEYNHERPHEALALKFPGEVYQKSDTRYHKDHDALNYGSKPTRKVSSAGIIKVANQEIFLSTALAGWPVRLEYHPDNSIDIYFSTLKLGTYDEATAAFERAGTGSLEGTSTTAQPTNNL